MTTAEELIAVEVKGLSKRFRKSSEPSKTLKERLLTWRQSTVEEFHALDGIDFDIATGETFGILGHNGSGKSTLLKCIAGTIRPTTGSVRVRGTLSALLELGAGFHPDLTGRENIFLNGSILGFSRARIEEIFDEIVDFSGLADFIDTQVKHYSSGMYARLGFAVAVNLEPDVLLIDEVLAVGDEAFQAKCVERVKGFQEAGRTICLVTHSPDMVRSLCDRAMVLDHGKLLHVGDVNEAIAIYRRSLDPEGWAAEQAAAAAEAEAAAAAAEAAANGTADGAIVLDGEVAERSPVRIEDAWVDLPPGGRAAYRPGEQVVVGVRFLAPEGEQVRARFQLHTHDGIHLADISSWDASGADIGPTAAVNEARFVIDDLPLTDGRYEVTLVLQDPHEQVEYDRHEDMLGFEVFTGAPVTSRVVLNVRLESGTSATLPTSA
ncbi:MAG: ABC transporter ATP-binding protein [Actinomycetota bacterium]